MDELQERVPLVKWRESLLAQLTSKREEDARLVAAIADLEKSTAANAEMIRSLSNQNNEYRQELLRRRENESIASKQKAALHRLRKLRTDLEAASSLRSPSRARPAFNPDLPGPSELSRYLDNLRAFEDRVLREAAEITELEREHDDVSAEISAVSRDIEALDAALIEHADQTRRLDDVNARILEIELFLANRGDYELTYAKYQAELRTVYEEAEPLQSAPQPVSSSALREFRDKKAELQALREQEARVNDALHRISEFIEAVIP